MWPSVATSELGPTVGDSGAGGFRVGLRQVPKDAGQFGGGPGESTIQVMSSPLGQSHPQRSALSTFQQPELHQIGDVVAGGLEVLPNQGQQVSGHLVGQHTVTVLRHGGDAILVRERLQQQSPVRCGQQVSARI